jgi:hypothetical protein
MAFKRAGLSWAGHLPMKGQAVGRPHSPISMRTVQTKIRESLVTMSHRRCKAAGHGPAGVRRRRQKLLLTHPLVLRRGQRPTPICKRIFLQNLLFPPSSLVDLEMQYGDGEDGVLGEALLMIPLLHYCGDSKKIWGLKHVCWSVFEFAC